MFGFSKEDRWIIKKMLSILRPYSKRIALIIVFIAASTAVNMLMPVIGKEIMDEGLLKNNFELILKLTLLTFGLFLLEKLLALLETWGHSYIGSMLSYDLTKKAFKHLLSLKISYFKDKSFSEVTGNIGIDVGNVSRIADRSTFFILTELLKVCGGMIGLVLIDIKLTLLVLAFVPIRLLVVNIIAKKNKELFEETIEANTEYAKWFGDTILGIKEIKLWGLQRIKIGRLIKKQRRIIKINMKLALIESLNEVSDSLIFHIITNALYIMGAYFIMKGTLTLGGLFAFLTYSVYVTAPVSSILNIGYSFSGILPSAKRLFEFLNIEEEEEKESVIPMNSETKIGILSFKEVSFSYQGEKKVLQKVSFEINRGEKVAIIGPNGSGKSTLINLILRLYQPDEGKIMINGLPVNHIRLSDYREAISVVSQDLYLFNTSIKENITAFMRVEEAVFERALCDSGAKKYVDHLPEKDETVIGSNGAMISGGERQKAAVARALVRDSQFVIFDEATSNLDYISEIKIGELMKGRLKKNTVLLITHQPELLKYVDKIIHLENGRIADMGSHDELYQRNTFYKKLMDTNLKVL